MNEENKIDEDFMQLRNPKEERDFITTKKIQDNPTTLNFKRLNVLVCDAVIKDSGLLSSGHVSYKVTTAPLGYEVRRKDGDFTFLRKILTRQYPHIIIPPCIAKAPKQIPKHMQKREKYYTRFLQMIVRSEELKNCQFLLDFLYDNEPKSFKKCMSAIDKVKFTNKIEEFVS